MAFHKIIAYFLILLCQSWALILALLSSLPPWFLTYSHICVYFTEAILTSHPLGHWFYTQQYGTLQKSGCFCLFGLYFFHSGSAITRQLIHHSSIVCLDEERHVSIAGNKDIKHLSLMLASLQVWPSILRVVECLHLYSLTQGSKKHIRDGWTIWSPS